MIQWLKKQWLRYRIWLHCRRIKKANEQMRAVTAALEACSEQWRQYVASRYPAQQDVVLVVVEEDESDESRVVN